MAKSIQIGPLAIGLGVSNGQAQITAGIDLVGQLGGGKAAGILGGKVGIHGEADLGAQQAADLAIMALEVAFPNATSMLELVRGAVDAEVVKVTV